jgi:hypothetical protein
MAVNQHYEVTTTFVGAMGENDLGVTMVPMITHMTTTSSNQSSSSSSSSYITGYDLLASGSLVYDFLIESIATVKQIRHGIPFALCTTGIVVDNPHNDSTLEMTYDAITKMDLSTLHVSLLAGTPTDYQSIMMSNNINSNNNNNNNKNNEEDALFYRQAFGHVCQFLAHCQENQIVPTEVHVVSSSSSTTTTSASVSRARDLALSLGAQAVHLHTE